MTILSQAETIRDETEKAANTAERVGDCLVDIANAIARIDSVDIPYACYMATSQLPTEIITLGEYVPVVSGDIAIDEVLNGFMQSDGIITRSSLDAAGFVTLFKVDVVMSAHSSTGTHAIHAALAIDGAVDTSTVTAQTLANGENKPSQVCISTMIEIANGQSVNVMITDEHNTEDIYVPHLAISITKVSLVAIAP